MLKRLFPWLLLVLVSCPVALPAQDSKENADFKLALNLYHDGLFDLAVEQLRQFVAAFPATAQGIEARYYLGMTQLKLKRYEEARMTFQSFALNYQDNPRAPEAWMRTGETYAALGNVKEAALAFERVKVFHPKSKVAPDALLQSARYFVAAGQRDDARRVLRIVLQEYPGSPAVLAARTQLGQMYFDDGNIEQAQQELRRVIDGDPSGEARAQALLILGNMQLATRKTDLAQASYQEILKDYKTSSAVPGALVNLGRLYLASGRAADAAEQFRRALSGKGPQDTSQLREALLGNANALAALNQHAEAAAAFDKFLSAFPTDERAPQALWLKALTAAKGKKYSISTAACQQLMRSSNPLTELLRRRAALRIARNAEESLNLSAAADAYQAFVDRYPDDPAAPAVLMTIGKLYEERLTNPRRAAGAYEAILSRAPNSPLADDALAGAARCYEKLREPDQALGLDHDLLTRFPASDLAPAVKERQFTTSIFEAKDKDAGIEKLAMLLGDVVAEKDRAGLSYRLGEIYFRDMKNYEAAAAQFTNAINSGVADARFVDALFFRAKSYEYLTARDDRNRAKAIDSYQTFLSSYPNDPRTRDARLALYFLRATSASAAGQALRDDSTLARRDTMMLRYADLLARTDSTGDALSVYHAITRDYPGTPSALEATYRIGVLLRAAGQPDSALTYATRYLAAVPAAQHTPEVLGWIAEGASARGDYETAIATERRLAGEFWYTAAGATARTALGKLLLDAGNAEDAEAAFAELVHEQETNPLLDDGADPQLLLGLARASQMAGHIAGAKSRLFEVIGRVPSGPVAAQAYTLLGWIAKAEGHLDVATTYFSQASTASPNASASRDIADLLFESGNFRDAITQYSALSKAAESDSARQYFDSRIILARLKNGETKGIPGAIDAYTEKYGKDNATLAAFDLERGGALFRAEDYAGAQALFAGILKKYDDTPSAPSARYWIGKTLEAQEKYPEAIAALEDLLKDQAAPDADQRTHLALGNLYYRIEKWPDAAKHYRVIVDSPHPDSSLLPFALSNLQETYEVSGVNDGALALARKYLELYPNADDSFDKKIKIGILYERLGYFDQAVLHLQSLLDQAGADLEGEIRYYIAEANYNKGDYQQAILDFLKVPYLVTKKGKIDWTANSLYMSGQSYEKMGKLDQALTMYQQITERAGIDETFKAAARKEIDRVRLVLKKGTR